MNPAKSAELKPKDQSLNSSSSSPLLTSAELIAECCTSKDISRIKTALRKLSVLATDSFDEYLGDLLRNEPSPLLLDAITDFIAERLEDFSKKDCSDESCAAVKLLELVLPLLPDDNFQTLLVKVNAIQKLIGPLALSTNENQWEQLLIQTNWTMARLNITGRMLAKSENPMIRARIAKLIDHVGKGNSILEFTIMIREIYPIAPDLAQELWRNICTYYHDQKMLYQQFRSQPENDDKVPLMATCLWQMETAVSFLSVEQKMKILKDNKAMPYIRTYFVAALLNCDIEEIDSSTIVQTAYFDHYKGYTPGYILGGYSALDLCAESSCPPKVWEELLAQIVSRLSPDEKRILLDKVSERNADQSALLERRLSNGKIKYKVNWNGVVSKTVDTIRSLIENISA